MTALKVISNKVCWYLELAKVVKTLHPDELREDLFKIQYHLNEYQSHIKHDFL